MSTLRQLYGNSLALLTDLYQLTMAYGYWRQGLADREAVFQLSFREAPFGGQFALACGLANAVEWLEGLNFSDDDRAYLEHLASPTGQRLFSPAFLDFLGRYRLRCDIDAVPEGTVVFAHEPLLRVRGPLIDGQLLETPMLNLINFPTLVATKAARVCRAAGKGTVLEFGLRRAQGIDGGVTASRAAYVGGCHATSNVLAGRLYGIPVRGTHAHSWVMAFGDELSAFRAYAEALPHNSIFLVDTYDTQAGVKHALEAGQWLRQHGADLNGVRLDSGDLVGLSRETRRMLDEAGFAAALIVASGDLDEYSMEQLRAEGAQVDIWGVGTRLATAYDQPALGGIYKLAAIRDDQGGWRARIKLSEQGHKMSDPGILQVRRFTQHNQFVGDVIYDVSLEAPVESAVDADGRLWTAPLGAAGEDLLIPVLRGGRPVYHPVGPAAARERTLSQLALLGERRTRFTHADRYPVGWQPALSRLRAQLADAARRGAS